MKNNVLNEVRPVFCLEEVKEFIDKDVWDCRLVVDLALAKYDHEMPTRSITLSAMNPHLSARSFLKQIDFETVFQRYGPQQDLLAEVPYLLGLVKHQSFLRRFQDFQTIEVFENKPEGLFYGKFGKNARHLCLHRSGSGYMVGISQYIQDGKMNASLGRSTNNLRVLTFVKESMTEAGQNKQEDLSQKMIG